MKIDMIKYKFWKLEMLVLFKIDLIFFRKNIVRKKFIEIVFMSIVWLFVVNMDVFF